MRQRLIIIATVLVVVGSLILLNGLGYAESSGQAESEALPNRSTYNAGPTGTRALYDLLNESGYKVSRWRESPALLLTKARNNVSTFVVIGRTLVPFEEDEARNLLLWVEKGGRLVLIDRRPEDRLLPKSGDWHLAVDLLQYPTTDIDPANAARMTEDVSVVRPVQPTRLTVGVDGVKPSRFASVIRMSYSIAATKTKQDQHVTTGHTTGTLDGPTSSGNTPAPVIHLQDRRGSLLVDYPHGAGRIIILSDPFIVANGGIYLEDNLQLALNTITGNGGLVAFDEFHQGRGVTMNAFAAYFAGTPILAIAAQIVLVVLAILWTQARRFARPLPLPSVDRRSSLEFVASMAELQQRARALDLAIENIYSRTRRVLTRYAGVDYHSSRSEIAERVAARSMLDKTELESVMRECEEAINGARITERQSIALAGRIRNIEASLGLRMRSRDVRQALSAQ